MVRIKSGTEKVRGLDKSNIKMKNKYSLCKKSLYQEVSFSDQQALEEMLKNAPKGELEYYWLRETIKKRKKDTHFPWGGLFVVFLIVGLLSFLVINSIVTSEEIYAASIKLCDMTHSGKLINIEQDPFQVNLKVICENATFITTSEDKAKLRNFFKD